MTRKMTWVNLPRRRDLKPPKGKDDDTETIHLQLSEPCYVFPKTDGQCAAPFYFTKIEGDFEVSLLVDAKLKECYDQSGLLVRTKKGGPYVTCGLQYYFNYNCEDTIGACSHIVNDVESAENELEIPREDLPYAKPPEETEEDGKWMKKPEEDESAHTGHNEDSPWAVYDLAKFTPGSEQSEPCWFKISRQGPMINTFYSEDGETYETLASKIFAMDHDSLQVGLYGASPNQARCRIEFDDFRIIP